LTTARGGSFDFLRRHFQILRKRIGRELGYVGFEYGCVTTREGNGVLHMLWAWVDLSGQGRRFYVDQRWLSDAWRDIHGAPIVYIKPVGRGDTDRRRLASYSVNQYVAGQNALVRWSSTRLKEISLPKLRQALWRVIKNEPRILSTLGAAPSLADKEAAVAWGRRVSSGWRAYFRECWGSLCSTRSCWVLDRQFVVLRGELFEL
jgi:hypothetical protein